MPLCMGIDLGDLVQKHPTSVQSFAGKTVAIDAWNVLYQFLTSVRGPDGRPLTDSQGRITSHLSGVLQRSVALVEHGIKPVWVFDGPPHPLKKDTLSARRERRDAAQVEYEDALASGDAEKAAQKGAQAVRMNWDMADDARKLVELLGLPAVQASMEGEAQASWMVANGQADVVASQDFDALLFGTPNLVRNLNHSGRRKLPGRQAWVDVTPENISLDECLRTNELSREQLIDVAILVGTDFNPGIKGVGPKGALKLIQTHGNLESALDFCATATSAVAKKVTEGRELLGEIVQVRDLFLNPPHQEVTVAKIVTPQRAEALEFLTGFEFNKARIEGVLDRLHKCAGRQSQQTLF